MTDQQNIADAANRYRDLQLALAFSFSAGRINFNQLNRFRRQLAYEAATIALNRTVTAFAYGDHTFGWRISPRYQTPPNEGSNVRVLANMLIQGGPGPNYEIKNSKLESGQRELTAAIIMPSFVTKARLEVSGNWYRLHDPDEITLATKHVLEQSRKVHELKQALATVNDAHCYPPDVLSRLETKVDQLVAMLPLQTHVISVPYENRLGGFELFTPGSSSLVPQLIGYQGADYVTSNGQNSLLLYGRNISIQETAIVAGGQQVPASDVEILSREVIRVKLPKNLLVTRAYTGRRYVEVHLATPNGISNRLLVPFQATDLDAPPGASAQAGGSTPSAAKAAPSESPAPSASPPLSKGALAPGPGEADAGVKPATYQLPALPSPPSPAADRSPPGDVAGPPDFPRAADRTHTRSHTASGRTGRGHARDGESGAGFSHGRRRPPALAHGHHPAQARTAPRRGRAGRPKEHPRPRPQPLGPGTQAPITRATGR